MKLRILIFSPVYFSNCAISVGNEASIGIQKEIEKSDIVVGAINYNYTDESVLSTIGLPLNNTDNAIPELIFDSRAPREYEISDAAPRGHPKPSASLGPEKDINPSMTKNPNEKVDNRKQSESFYGKLIAFNKQLKASWQDFRNKETKEDKQKNVRRQIKD